MSVARILLPAMFAALAASPALAVDDSLQLVINLPANVQRVVTNYQCEGMAPFAVEYINADPVFLAFVPIGGEKTLFVHVLAADGAKYASGQYEWWSKANSATLTDLTAGTKTKPVTCDGVNDTP